MRGLKQQIPLDNMNRLWSHPEWVRGLKQRVTMAENVEISVASRVGAWIETLHPAW